MTHVLLVLDLTLLTLIMTAAVYGAHALLLPHGAHRVPRLRLAGR
jgi:hypothetical protein